MEKHIIQVLCEERHDDEDNISVRSYSGRAMYGRSCLGIVGDSPTDIMAAILYKLADERYGNEWSLQKTKQALHEIALAFSNVRTDSLGLSSIIYFPEIEFVESEEEEECHE